MTRHYMRFHASSTAADTVDPVVTIDAITDPPEGGTLLLTGTVSDNVAVSSVSLIIRDAGLTTIATLPATIVGGVWSATWTPVPSAASGYTVVATATDTASNAATATSPPFDIESAIDAFIAMFPPTGQRTYADRDCAPTPLSTVTVTTGIIGDLQTAVNAATAGTEIVVTGNYTGMIDLTGKNGTLTNPITLKASAAGAKITSTGSNPTIWVRNCSHIVINGFEFDGDATSNAVLAIAARYGNIGSQGGAGNASFIDICDCHIHNSGQILVKIVWNAQNINCHHNTLEGAGIQDSRYGEGFYIGSSDTGLNGHSLDDTHTILVAYNDISNCTAEPVDLKSQGTHDVTVTQNTIHDCIWPLYASTKYNNGIIAVGQQRDGVDGDVLGDPNYSVTYNRIWNCTGHASAFAYQDAAGVMAWSPAVVDHNIIWDVGNDGIEFRDGYSGAGFHDYAATRNTVWNAATQDGNDGISVSGALPGAAVVDMSDNVSVTAGATTGSGNLVAVSGDFLGPVVGSADAGGGPGSGFILANTSAIPAGAGAAGKVL